jgi:hypothetical protein
MKLSICKLLVLKRVQDGKVSLDENINNKLQTWKLNAVIPAALFSNMYLTG